MIGTSYYGNKDVQAIGKLGIKLVSISRSTPSNIRCTHYDDLKPSWELISHWKKYYDEKFYRKAYEIKLNKLDPHQVYKDLDKSILLCYELPHQFCHRHLVAEWLQKYGYEIEEV